MQNLELTTCSHAQLFGDEDDDAHKTTSPSNDGTRISNKHATIASCVDPVNSRAFIISNSGILDIYCQAKGCQRLLGRIQLTIDAEKQPSAIDFSDLLCIEWLDEASALHAIFRCGTIVGFVLSEDFQSAEPGITIGQIVEGVACAAWSPDLEEFVVVTNENSDAGAKLLILARGLTFTILSDCGELDTEQKGDQHFISVGWGKKETQFQGKAGKDARTAAVTAPAALNGSEVVDDINQQQHLDPVVSWREDCSNFAVSSITRHNPHQRIVRIYDRTGVLQYTCEEIPPPLLGSALAWRPSGNLIAASYAAITKPPTASKESAVAPDVWQVIFFEKNGLRHGEFSLPNACKPSRCKLSRILWNSDSSVCAVVVEFVLPTTTTQTFIMLYTMKNYHWYLKYTLPLARGARLDHIAFDPRDSLLLHLIIDFTHHHLINFRRTICTSPTTNSISSSVYAAVIDGNRVLITCFGEQRGVSAIIPPPMCSYSATIVDDDPDETFPVCVTSCRFQRIGEKLILIVVTSDFKCLVFGFPDDSKTNDDAVAADDKNSNLRVIVRREQAVASLPLMQHLLTFNCAAPAGFQQQPPQRLLIPSDAVIVRQDEVDEKLTFVLIDKQQNTSSSTFMAFCTVAIDNNNDNAVLLPIRVQADADDNDAVNSPHSKSLPLCCIPEAATTSDGETVKLIIPFLTFVDEFDISIAFCRYSLSLRNDSVVDDDHHHHDDEQTAVVAKRENLLKLRNTIVDDVKIFSSCCTTNRPTKEKFVDLFTLNTATGRLYFNFTEIADDCTSFALHDDKFLIFTTSRDELKCVALNFFSPSIRNFTKLVAMPAFNRACEKGARIVACSKTQVVLEMPRGNLETVYPRALVVQAIFSLLKTKQYADAYQLARRHRVNSNILYDFSPSSFQANIDEFISQMLQLSAEPQRSDYLELFIADFDAENCLKSDEYKELFKVLCDSTAENIEGEEGKAFQPTLLLLQQRLSDKLAKNDDVAQCRLLFKPILATYAKLCQFEEALMCCKVWRGGGAAEQKWFSLDEALKFLMYWIHDINALFDYALATYDFEIALLVGQKSTRNPAEFVPLLRQFRQLSPLSYQHYAIDRHLRKHKRALINIVECVFELTMAASTNTSITSSVTVADAEKLLIELVNEQRLYVDAICLIVNKLKQQPSGTSTLCFDINTLLNTIRCNYADNLRDVFQNRKEAAYQFYHAAAYESAAREFELLGSWHMALVCNSRLKNVDINALAQKAVRKLIQSRKFDDALNISLVWLSSENSRSDDADDDEEGQKQTSPLALCFNGHFWQKAFVLLQKSENNDNKINSNQMEKLQELKQAIMQQTRVLCDDVKKFDDKFHEYFERLMLVRKQRHAKMLRKTTEEGTGDAGSDIGDDSASTVMSTTSTSSSHMSSVSRHKTREDRKKRSLKAGGRYEHLALLEALRNDVYAPALAMQDAVLDTLNALAMCAADNNDADEAVQLGSTLQNKYAGLVNALRYQSSAIWRVESLLSEVFQLNACYDGAATKQSSVFQNVMAAPGHIEKSLSEALFVEGMSAEDVGMFVAPKIDLTKWNDSMLMLFKESA